MFALINMDKSYLQYLDYSFHYTVWNILSLATFSVLHIVRLHHLYRTQRSSTVAPFSSQAHLSESVGSLLWSESWSESSAPQLGSCQQQQQQEYSNNCVHVSSTAQITQTPRAFMKIGQLSEVNV